MLIEIPDPIELRYELDKRKAADHKAWRESHMKECIRELKSTGGTRTRIEEFAMQCKNAGYDVVSEDWRGITRWWIISVK